MVKSFEKIFIVLLIVTLAFGIVGLNYSYAAEASITISSAKVNQEFTVTVNIPKEATGYQGKIEVTFSDKTTLSSGVLANVPTNISHPGNMIAKFKASSSGTATVKVTGLIITTQEGNQLNSKTELTQTINIEEEKVPQPTTSNTSTEKPATPPPAPTTPSAPTTSTDSGYTPTGDTVYALEKLNVRKSASSSSEKIGQLAKGASTKRIAVGSNGWDKIEYNGTIGYVATQYLTTQKPSAPSENTVTNTVNNENTTTDNKSTEPTWTTTGDTVYSLKSLNVREGWGTSFKSVGGLSIGQKVKRIAVGSNGWDKIQYEGKQAYVLSKYVTTSKEEADKLLEKIKSDENEIANNVINKNAIDNNTIGNNVANNANVSVNAMTNEEMYNMLVDEIGVIPQVGKSIVDYIYIIGVVTGLISIGFVSTKIHEKNEE